jgi:arylsulfatase A-like enzyme
VMVALENAGADDNTVVFFLSDNGGCASWPRAEEAFVAYNGGKVLGGVDTYEFVGKSWGWAQNAPFRRHKTWTYEGGIATPMIVRWPEKVAAGEITHRVGHVMDFMPTLIELAGGEYPGVIGGEATLPMEGQSFLTLLDHEAEEEIHHELAWELYGNRALRQGKWKLVWGAGLQKWELYDMVEDRTETNDLASVHPEKVSAMSAAWQQWADTKNDQ